MEEYEAIIRKYVVDKSEPVEMLRYPENRGIKSDILKSHAFKSKVLLALQEVETSLGVQPVVARLK